MKKILLPLIIILISCCTLNAQYDEKTILYQQAQQMMAQRQYSQAELAWLNVLQKFPNDLAAISQLFQLYLQTGKSEAAENLMQKYQNILPDNIRMEYAIQLDIQQAKLTDAWQKTEAYMQVYSQDINKYRLLAGYFERKSFFEQSILIYEKARKTLNRNDLFNMEIGNSAFYSHNYPLAMIEYIRFLEAQPGNLYFVSNQLNTMLGENPELINNLKTLAQSSVSIEVKEVYAISLNRMNRLQQALAEYEQLPVEKLTAFANELITSGRDSLAIAAFHGLLNRQIDINTRGDIYLKTAQAYLRLKKYADAESTLSQIVDTRQHTVNTRFTNKRFAFQAYLILADLAAWQGKQENQIINLLNDAKAVAVNAGDQAEVNYRLISNYFAHEQFDQAEQLLKIQNKSSQPDRNLYYQYLITLARKQIDKADTLLNELILTSPSSSFVNDLMTLNILMLNLKGDAQSELLNAYRYRLSHRDSLAIETVITLAERIQDEELRMLAADWALISGYRSKAIAIYDYSWKDELRIYSNFVLPRLVFPIE